MIKAPQPPIKHPEPPAAKSGTFLRTIAAFLLLQSVPLLAPLIFLVRIVPIYAEVYAGFGTPLPWPTRLFIQLSMVAKQWFGLLFLQTIIWGLVVNGLAGYYGGKRALILLTMCLWLGFVLFLLMGGIALYQPILKMSP